MFVGDDLSERLRIKTMVEAVGYLFVMDDGGRWTIEVENLKLWKALDLVLERADDTAGLVYVSPYS